MSKSRILELMKLQVKKGDLVQKAIWRAFSQIAEMEEKQKAIWEAFQDRRLKKIGKEPKMNLLSIEKSFSLKFTLDVSLEREDLYSRLQNAIQVVQTIINTTDKPTLKIRAYRLLGDLINKAGTLLKDVEIEDLEREVEALKKAEAKA